MVPATPPLSSLFDKTRLYFPTIVISDTHLGKGVASADMLYEFLQHTKCDHLILNGDIIDGWHLQKKKKKRTLPEMHLRVLDTINRMAATGTTVTYIAGNHDENLRRSKIMQRIADFGLGARIAFRNGYFYDDPQDRRFLILHGDQFDNKELKTKAGRWLSRRGDEVYDGLIRVNQVVLHVSKKWLNQQFSIASYVKRKTKKTLGIIESFEKAVAKSANVKNIQGVIGGHIHHAEIRDIDGVTYMNSGDWVESCTALAHDADGQWTVVRWADQRALLGLGKLPDEQTPHPDLAWRPATERQMRFFHWLWPHNQQDIKLKKLARFVQKQTERHENAANFTSASRVAPQGGTQAQPLVS